MILAFGFHIWHTSENLFSSLYLYLFCVFIVSTLILEKSKEKEPTTKQLYGGCLGV